MSPDPATQRRKQAAAQKSNGATGTRASAEKNRLLRTKGGNPVVLDVEELEKIDTRDELLTLLRKKKVKVKKALAILEYESQLEQLQIELVKLQHWVQQNNKRVAIVFEGRDAAGKGGTIRRFIEHLNPRAMRVVALPKPTEVERGQWYFQRYAKQLPNPGEIVFFDRSWYNRAVVEPVNGFCTQKQYDRFMRQVPEFEHMLFEDGIHLVKFWLAISKSEQKKRFDARAKSPLKHWKLSPIDAKAQSLWDDYTRHKDMMFSRTHTSYSPWIIVETNNKRQARLAAIRHVLSTLPYDGREESEVSLQPDPDVLMRYHHSAQQVDC